MRRLATSVAVHRPSGSVILPAGSVPTAADALLVTNPACWEDATDTVDDASDEQVGVREGKPDLSWKKDEIKAWAASRGIDLDPAKTKPDMLAVIEVTAGVDLGEGPADGDDGEGQGDDDDHTGDPALG